ncbi:MAG TPA: glycine cleavage system protein H [Candidatus Nitrosotenuis sp.]|nr:glycine cleavage system protein H [Candidatus Nitrosotenuis sp.]
MSILFALVTFLLFITISYIRSMRLHPAQVAQGPRLAKSWQPQLVDGGGFNIPKNFSFHVGHTWAVAEDKQRARVGLDSFAANLLGSVDSIEMPGLNRWVRQGQKVCKVRCGETTVELVAPVEGIVVAVNSKLRDDPGLAIRDPYGEGWLFSVHSPELSINLKNLLRGGLVHAWMRNSIERVAALAAGVAPALAQDGGLPVAGLLNQVDAALQHKMINEFFLG